MFFSSQHEKAAQYFQRALKLSPGYLSALTLLGDYIRPSVRCVHVGLNYMILLL